MFTRSAGILMSITSLPSPYGIGTLGKEAYEFADFLKKSGQKYWQVLPVGHTEGPVKNCPYLPFSIYAGSPYLIDLDFLEKDGLLQKSEYQNLNWGNDRSKVDYEKIYNLRFLVLEKAYNRAKSTRFWQEFTDFAGQENSWLETYSLYMALTEHFGNTDWRTWPEDISMREPESLNHYKEKLKEKSDFWKFLQFLFFKQWKAFKNYVNEQGIFLIGDIPIYVSLDGSDTWEHKKVFQFDGKGTPLRLGGCPPDGFSATGQNWNAPLYDWDYLKKTDYSWWIERVRQQAEMFDAIRIDHFRGLDSYYSISSNAETAENGRWEKGPEIHLFKALRQALGKIAFIAEDLGGEGVPGVQKLLKQIKCPCMRVLQNAFGPSYENMHKPHYYRKNSVVYTGTHDNDTIIGWLNTVDLASVKRAEIYAKLNKEEGYNWGFIRLAYSSISDLAIVPMQDFLGLGKEGRMNVPSVVENNWNWRMQKDKAIDSLAAKIYNLSEVYGRIERIIFMDNEKILQNMKLLAGSEYCKELSELSVGEMHNILGKVIMAGITKNWQKSKEIHENHRRAYYFSAEWLIGRLIYNNLFSLGILNNVKELLEEQGIDINSFEDIDDPALGNGGLGRLAACFLDSAATHEVPLNGYGIRYKYGLFKQLIQDGSQIEEADDWQRFGDPWSIRREEDTVTVEFADFCVKAVPYDMAIIGYGTQNINTLRLWQAEAISEFDFVRFNRQDYHAASAQKNESENICKVLYPNDDTNEGKALRLRQQYFFSSASVQDIIKRYKKAHGSDFSAFAGHCAIQLNDTHPVIAIPELIKLLQKEGMSFDDAFEIAQKTFNYTNHTVMAEALETWDINLVKKILPRVFDVILTINNRLIKEFTQKSSENLKGTSLNELLITDENQLYMARLAVYATSYINGVAGIHTQILKDDVLKEWYNIYPQRFQNKTNGITQRRWLGLCNPALSDMLSSYIGDNWLKDLSQLQNFKQYVGEATKKFKEIKQKNKQILSDYIQKIDGIFIDPSFIFDIQVKRLHEYKRQLMNAFSIMAIYFRLKEGNLPEFTPTAFIFGAKAAPGYKRAKAIIRYITAIAKLINNDPQVSDKLKVVFVSNYNCSYAEKLVPAADISEQISMAGTEASGTGNMKFMLNGAVTLGTFDGANIEITEQAGVENNYIFGAKAEEINQLKRSYNPLEIYNSNKEVRRVVDTLLTFDDAGREGEGSLAELYTSLLEDSSWQRADNYFILHDLPSYIEAKLQANKDYLNRDEFTRKCLINTASAGLFSSDRTIKQYAEEIWHL